MSFGASTSNTSGNTDTTAVLQQLFNQLSAQTQQGSSSLTSSNQSTGQTSGTNTNTTAGTESSTGTTGTTSTGQQSGSTARTLTPDQQAAEANIARVSKSLMSNPAEFIAPAQNAAREQVNQNYSGLGESLRQQFLSGGGGASGKYGTAALAGDLARRAQLSNVDNTAAVAKAQLPITAAGLSQNLLNTNLGETTASTQQGTQAGTSTATGTTGSTSTGTNSAQQILNQMGQQSGQTSQSGTTSTTGGNTSTGVTNAQMGQSTNQASGKI